MRFGDGGIGVHNQWRWRRCLVVQDVVVGGGEGARASGRLSADGMGGHRRRHSGGAATRESMHEAVHAPRWISRCGSEGKHAAEKESLEPINPVS